MGENVIDILAEILILLIFSNKSNSPQCQHLHTSMRTHANKRYISVISYKLYSMLKGESHVSRNVPRSLCNSR